MEIIRGDATRPRGVGERVIVHVCNDAGRWGRGFVVALSRRWPEAEARYRAWFRGDEALPFELGQVQFVCVSDQLWIANLIGQHGLRRRGAPSPIRYDALRTGLATLAQFALARGASVHMPRIGVGLAGGDWLDVSRIVLDELVARGLNVTVYDLPTPRVTMG